MSTATPFAYNTGAPIDGTTQVGDLAVGTPTSGFTNSPQFWDGPDEELGYVIAVPVSGNTQPTPISGVTASVGFYRTKDFLDSSFVNLAQFVSRKFGNPQSFTGATEASSWLTTNGFWNSYTTALGPYYLHYNYTDASGNGWITFPNHNVGAYNDDPNLVGSNGYAIYINDNDFSGNNNSATLDNLTYSAGTLTLTQGSNSASYLFTSPNGFENTGYGGTENYWDNSYESAQLGTLGLISSASTIFNDIDPVSITVTTHPLFTLNSSDFVYSSSSTGSAVSGNATGFSVGGSYGSGESFYGPNLSVSQGGSSVKSNEILAFWSGNGLSVNNNAYLFNVAWGEGSSVQYGVVVVSFYYNGNDNTRINIGTVDTSVPGWNTSGSNIYSTLRAVQGTFNFPAMFSLYVPQVTDNDNWC